MSRSELSALLRKIRGTRRDVLELKAKRQRLTGKVRLRSYSRELLSVTGNLDELDAFLNVYASSFISEFKALCEQELEDGDDIFAEFDELYVTEEEIAFLRKMAVQGGKIFDLAAVVRGREVLPQREYQALLDERLAPVLEPITLAQEKYLQENVEFILSHALRNLETLLQNLQSQVNSRR